MHLKQQQWTQYCTEYVPMLKGRRDFFSCEICAKGKENNVGLYTSNIVVSIMLKIVGDKTEENCDEREL